MWRLALVSLLAILAGALGVTQPWKGRAAPPPIPSEKPSPRLVYPANLHAVLTLPDGQQEEIRSLLNVARPLRYGDYIWNEDGVPPGPTWIRVDLSKQTLSIFRGGHEIGAAVILYGTDGKPTPRGVFPVLERAAMHRSTLYDADMPFMLRLTGDGVAIHASDVRYGHATHGCIGVPPAFAQLLFEHMRRGDLVAIIASPGSSGESARPSTVRNS